MAECRGDDGWAEGQTSVSAAAAASTSSVVSASVASTGAYASAGYALALVKQVMLRVEDDGEGRSW